MGKFISVAVVAVITVAVGIVVLVAVMAGSGSGSAGSASQGPSGVAGPGGGAPGSAGIQPGAAIPSGWLALYQGAATTCAGLSWSVLAAIGTVETGSGQSTAGAEGPLQFEPATFAAYAVVGPGGVQPASPYDPTDAVYTASALVCRNGAGGASTLRAAIASYNHSDSYVNTVLTLALAFEEDPGLSGTVVTALSYAAQQLNTPYVWGGTGNGGFDCSGLAQVAYRKAGIALPRVAQAQFDAGPLVPAGSTVQPGDLIFFGGGPGSIDHVGLYVGAGEMIDAPHTGALVRFDSAHWSGLAGATRPG
jgi:cell wall-associated NlpC family hydrolase